MVLVVGERMEKHDILSKALGWIDAVESGKKGTMQVIFKRSVTAIHFKLSMVQKA